MRTNFPEKLLHGRVWKGHRSQVTNLLLTLAVYATICNHAGLSFRFPGARYTWEHFCDMVGRTCTGDQKIWAAVSDKAKNQASNCVNGDFFTSVCGDNE
ncbi:Iridoid synthase [Vitis vinifera]|uniref:Iridoid synthase n=1 Tax=Vitis vinifera TaxID=29760 RepID=A0A438DWP1_VITVI|nr:Iridoid synthase [Vitis vinifera]